MSESDQPSLASGSTPERMLAEVVAGHFIGARVVEADSAQVMERNDIPP